MDLIVKIRSNYGRASNANKSTQRPLKPLGIAEMPGSGNQTGPKGTSFHYYSLALDKLLNFVSYINEGNSLPSF